MTVAFVAIHCQEVEQSQNLEAAWRILEMSRSSLGVEKRKEQGKSSVKFLPLSSCLIKPFPLYSSTGALITRTVDGVVRLWMPVIDEPNSMRVWTTIDPNALTSSEKSQDSSEQSQACYYLSSFDMSIMLGSSLQWLQRDLQMAELCVGKVDNEHERTLDLKRSRAKRLEHLVTETPDMFALLQLDGTLVIRAVANVDRRPPTLCQSFIVLKMPTQLAIEPSSIANISAHALATSSSSTCYTPTGLLHLTLFNGDTIKLQITPSLLFDGLVQGLTQIDNFHDILAINTLQSTRNDTIIPVAHQSADGAVATVSQNLKEGYNLNIHDTHSDFYNTKPEAVLPISEAIIDLAWSPRSTHCPTMLAVATRSKVLVISRRRLTHLNRIQSHPPASRWLAIAQANLTNIGVLPITGVAWQSDCSLLIAASDLLFNFSGLLLLKGSSEIPLSETPRHVVQLAAQQSGPLPDHDPEVILECLFWNKIGLAIQIFANLAFAIDTMIPSEPLLLKTIAWDSIERVDDRQELQRKVRRRELHWYI